MDAQLMRLLVQLPICRGLKEPEVAELFEVCEDKALQLGDLVVREGEPGDGLYVVLEGAVEIFKKDRSGTQQVLARLGDGSVVGEMSLITGNSARSASVRAVSQSRVLKVSSQRFNELLRGERLCALKVVHNLAQVMSRRLLLMDEKLVEAVERGKKKEEMAEFQKILTQWAF